MLLLFTDKIAALPFGTGIRKHISEQTLLAIVCTAREVDNNRGSAEWFFNYIHECWMLTYSQDPSAFVILSETRPPLYVKR